MWRSVSCQSLSLTTWSSPEPLSSRSSRSHRHLRTCRGPLPALHPTVGARRFIKQVGHPKGRECDLHTWEYPSNVGKALLGRRCSIKYQVFSSWGLSATNQIWWHKSNIFTIHYHIANEMNVIKVSLIQIPLMYGSRPMNMKTDTPALLFECLIMEINEVMFILMCALVHVSGILISTHTIKMQCRKHAKDADFTWIREEMKMLH